MYFHQSETIIIGKYAVNWHEGDLAITLATYIDEDNRIVPDELILHYNDCTVNSEWEAREAIKWFKEMDNPPFKLHLVGAEQTDIATFVELSSVYQDRIMPFEWEDILLTKKPRELSFSDRIPKGIFDFKFEQEGVIAGATCRRYELRENDYAMSKLLTLAYNIIKNDWELDGYPPKEISIELTGKHTPIEDSFINSIVLILNKESINHSIISDLIKFVDGFELKITWFILWTDTKKSSQKNKRRAISGKTRQNVLMRDNYTCQICGATVKDGAKLEIDHLVPVSKGGTNDENNLQVLCQQCNREKHNRTDLLHDKRKLAELEGK